MTTLNIQDYDFKQIYLQIYKWNFKDTRQSLYIYQ